MLKAKRKVKTATKQRSTMKNRLKYLLEPSAKATLYRAIARELPCYEDFKDFESSWGWIFKSILNESIVEFWDDYVDKYKI
jgi:hypothetical protein